LRITKKGIWSDTVSMLQNANAGGGKHRRKEREQERVWWRRQRSRKTESTKLFGNSPAANAKKSGDHEETVASIGLTGGGKSKGKKRERRKQGGKKMGHQADSPVCRETVALGERRK